VALTFLILRDFAERCAPYSKVLHWPSRLLNGTHGEKGGLRNREKQEATTERLEALGKLQVQKETSGRTVALSRLRGVNRPIIIAGSSTHVKQGLREAQGFKAEFETRGIIIVRAPPSPAPYSFPRERSRSSHLTPRETRAGAGGAQRRGDTGGAGQAGGAQKGLW